MPQKKTAGGHGRAVHYRAPGVFSQAEARVAEVGSERDERFARFLGDRFARRALMIERAPIPKGNVVALDVDQVVDRPEIPLPMQAGHLVVVQQREKGVDARGEKQARPRSLRLGLTCRVGRHSHGALARTPAGPHLHQFMCVSQQSGVDGPFEDEILAGLEGVRQEPEEPGVEALGRVGRERLRDVDPEHFVVGAAGPGDASGKSHVSRL